MTPERLNQDNLWKVQKAVNAQANLALFEGVRHGQYYRRETTAKEVMHHQTLIDHPLVWVIRRKMIRVPRDGRR